jgi:carbonic anhydrase/acetyltransferase-like protein (isoleucine patch superfamily)
MIYSLGERRIETCGEEFFVAPTAAVIGTVRLGRWASVWFSAVLRGDTDWIDIGDGSNVQDGSILHTDAGTPLRVGRNVTIGHGALLHTCRIGANAFRTAFGLFLIALNRACAGPVGSRLPCSQNETRETAPARRE